MISQIDFRPFGHSGTESNMTHLDTSFGFGSYDQIFEMSQVAGVSAARGAAIRPLTYLFGSCLEVQYLEPPSPFEVPNADGSANGRKLTKLLSPNNVQRLDQEH
jgi:hypothetical protein